MRLPRTPEEWKEAVQLAEASLLIESARQYGLITGGPEVNCERCIELLREGAALGYRPDQQAAIRLAAETFTAR